MVYNDRCWKYFKEKDNRSNIKVSTYNILSQSALLNYIDKYSQCQKSCLHKEFRWDLLKTELSKLNSDIICMQEVDPELATQYLPEYLKNNNLSIIYATGRQDSKFGCSLIFKNNLSLIDHKIVKFDGPDFSYREGSYVAIIAVFKCNPHIHRSEKTFIICTTHLIFGLDLELTRIKKMRNILKSVKEVAAIHNFPTVILCGDFNSYPNENFMKLIFRKEVIDHDDFTRGLDFVQEFKELCEWFKFKSIYQLPEVLPVENGNCVDLKRNNIYTCCIDGISCYVDYILMAGETKYQPSVVGYLDLPLTDYPKITPNETNSSDHLPLSCIISFTY